MLPFFPFFFCAFPLPFSFTPFFFTLFLFLLFFYYFLGLLVLIGFDHTLIAPSQAFLFTAFICYACVFTLVLHLSFLLFFYFIYHHHFTPYSKLEWWLLSEINKHYFQVFIVYKNEIGKEIGKNLANFEFGRELAKKLAKLTAKLTRKY